MFDLEVKKISRGHKFSGLKLVQISDLHISDKNLETINDVKDLINTLCADVVVITGDFICNGGDYLKELFYVLKKIDAKVGKFACMGNHDYADGDDGDRVQKVLRKADFKLLKNSRDDVFYNNYCLGFSGVDDYDAGFVDYSSVTRGDIILSHNPITFLKAKKIEPTLMLSGHTHGGQLKWEFLRALYYRCLGCDFLSGFYNSNESLLYVNRGLGNVVFKPKFFGKQFQIHTPRINASAEVTVFEFE